MSYKVLKHIVFLSCYDVPMYFRQCLYLLFSVNVSWGVVGLSRESRIRVEGGRGTESCCAPILGGGGNVMIPVCACDMYLESVWVQCDCLLNDGAIEPKL